MHPPGISACITFLFAVCASFAVQAQGPGMNFTQSAGTYTPITGGTVITSGSFDDAVFSITLPQPFPFRGVNYSDVQVSTNGWVSMGTGSLSSSLYFPISSTVTSPGIISPFGCDLQNASSGSPGIRWQQVGAEIIFQWQDVKRFTATANTESFSFQASLHTVTGEIKFVYGAFQNITTSTSNWPEVGIRTSNNSFPISVYNRLVNTDSPTNDWSTSGQGTANNSRCRISSAIPATIPGTGLTFSWTPIDCTSLTCTTNLSPAGGATINSSSVTLSWTPVPGNVFYNLYIGTTLPLNLQGVYSTTTATISGLAANTTYYWYVSPGGFNCSVSGCEATITSFNSGCPALTCNSSTAPANGSNVSGVSPVTISWTAAPNATAYDLYLSGTNPPSLQGTYTTTSTSLTLPLGTYYWYVVPKNACSIATDCESNIRSFNVVCPAISCTSNTAPANGSTLTAAGVTLSWASAANATSYDLYIAANNPPLTPLRNVGNTTSFNIPLANGTYYWYVVPKNSCGQAVDCQTNVTSFTVNAAGGVPNDVCLSAQDLLSVLNTSLTPEGARFEVNLFFYCFNSNRPDLWYKFRAIAPTASVTVTPVGSSCWDPSIEVLSGTCNNQLCLAGDDAGSCSTVNSVSLNNLTVGNIYFVRIASISSTTPPAGSAYILTGTNIGSTLSALPLTLVSFSGQVTSSNVKLQWKTVNETNVDRFEVERSVNGSVFERVASVPATNTAAVHDYSVTDINPFTAGSTVYYRLKSIDTDDTYYYSNVIRLTSERTVSFSVYPNPVTDVLVISGLGKAGDLRLLSMEGKIIKRQLVTAHTTTMDLGRLPKGMYLLQYHVNGEVIHQKVMKQ